MFQPTSIVALARSSVAAARIGAPLSAGAAAAPRAEQFVEHGIVDDAGLDRASDHAGDRDAVMGRAAREIRGAVDGIDDPDRRALRRRAALALLADEAVVGKAAISRAWISRSTSPSTSVMKSCGPLKPTVKELRSRKRRRASCAGFARDRAGGEKAALQRGGSRVKSVSPPEGARNG